MRLKDIEQKLEETFGGEFRVELFSSDSANCYVATDEVSPANKTKCMEYLREQGIEPIHRDLAVWQATGLFLDNLIEDEGYESLARED